MGINIWGKHHGQTGDGSWHIQNKIIDKATEIIVIVFLTFISTSVNADQPQMGNRKAKAMPL